MVFTVCVSQDTINTELNACAVWYTIHTCMVRLACSTSFITYILLMVLYMHWMTWAKYAYNVFFFIHNHSSLISTGGGFNSTGNISVFILPRLHHWSQTQQETLTPLTNYFSIFHSQSFFKVTVVLKARKDVRIHLFYYATHTSQRNLKSGQIRKT